MSNIQEMLVKHKDKIKITDVLNSKKIKRDTKRPWQDKVKNQPTATVNTRNTEKANDNMIHKLELKKLKEEIAKEKKKTQELSIQHKKILQENEAKLREKLNRDNKIVYTETSMAEAINPRINGQEINFKLLEGTNSFFTQLNEPTRRLYFCLIKISQNGKYKDVHIGYSEANLYGLQSGQLKDAREMLISMKLIEVKHSHKKGVSKKVFFYTLAPFDLNFS